MFSKRANELALQDNREVNEVTEHERNIALTIEKAVANLPEDKKQYFIGYAEGVAAMVSLCKPTTAA